MTALPISASLSNVETGLDYLGAVGSAIKKGVSGLHEIVLHPVDKMIIPVGSLILDARTVYACHQLSTDPDSFLARDIDPAECQPAFDRMYDRALHVKQFFEDFAASSGPKRVEILTTFFVAAALPGVVLRLHRFGKLEVLTSGKSGNVIHDFLRNDSGKVRLSDTLVPGAKQKDVVKAFQKVGYEIVPARGKGSHIIMKKEGYPTITVPNRAMGRFVSKYNKILSGIDSKTIKGILTGTPLAGIPLSDIRAYLYEAPDESLLFNPPPLLTSTFEMDEMTHQIERSSSSSPPGPLLEPVVASQLEETVKDILHVVREVLGISTKAEKSKLPRVDSVCVPLDKPRNAIASVSAPLGKLSEVGATIPLKAPQDSTLRVATSVEGSQVGVAFNPRNPKATTITLTQNLGGLSHVGLMFNPAKPHKPRIVGSVNIQGVSVGGAIDLKHPQRSVISVSVPVYGIPVGITTPLNDLEKAKLTIGFPGTPLQVAIPLKRLVKIQKKLPHVKVILKTGKKIEKVWKKVFGRKKKKHRHKKRDKVLSHVPAAAPASVVDEHLIKLITEAAKACYKTADDHWLIPNKPLQTYFDELMNDWENTKSSEMAFLEFLNQVHGELYNGNLAAVLSLSPSAHPTGPIAPPEVVEEFARVSTSIDALEASVEARQSLTPLSDQVGMEYKAAIGDFMDLSQQLKMAVEAFTNKINS